MIDVKQLVRNLKIVAVPYSKTNIKNRQIIEKIGILYFLSNAR